MTKRILIAGLVFIAASIFIAATAKANNGVTNKLPLQVELKVAGTHNNLPLIQLTFNTVIADAEYSISIKDNDGVELYSGNVKGTSVKSFAINSEEVGDTPLHFEIKEKSSGKTVTYLVQQASNIIKQTSIIRL